MLALIGRLCCASYSNTSISSKEREMLQEHDPKASVSTEFSSPSKLTKSQKKEGISHPCVYSLHSTDHQYFNGTGKAQVFMLSIVYRVCNSASCFQMKTVPLRWLINCNSPTCVCSKMFFLSLTEFLWPSPAFFSGWWQSFSLFMHDVLTQCTLASCLHYERVFLTLKNLFRKNWKQFLWIYVLCLLVIRLWWKVEQVARRWPLTSSLWAQQKSCLSRFDQFLYSVM